MWRAGLGHYVPTKSLPLLPHHCCAHGGRAPMQEGRPCRKCSHLHRKGALQRATKPRVAAASGILPLNSSRSPSTTTTSNSSVSGWCVAMTAACAALRSRGGGGGCQLPLPGGVERQGQHVRWACQARVGCGVQVSGLVVLGPPEGSEYEWRAHTVDEPACCVGMHEGSCCVLLAPPEASCMV
jgi:hypothetical protein